MKQTKILLYVTLLLLIAVTIVNLPIFKSYPPKKPTFGHGGIVRLVKDGKTFCSGVVVNRNTIITASHCVIIETPFGGMLDTKPIDIRGWDNEPLDVMATPYGARIQLDQALLHGDFKAFSVKPYISSVKELNALPKTNLKLISCGYPMGGQLFCSEQEFKGLYDFMWATRGLLLPGMSGGPVMLQDGTVVAINVAVNKDYSVVSPIYNIELQFKEK